MSESHDGISRNDHPEIRKRCLDLRRVQATEQLKVVVLSPWIQGFDTHWVGGHTEPCTLKSLGRCDLHDVEAPYKWIGFLHCHAPTEKKTFFLELTDHAWKSTLEAKSHHELLRGLVMVFSRERKNIKSPVQCVLISDTPMEDKRLPAAKDVIDSLKVAWKKFFRS